MLDGYSAVPVKQLSELFFQLSDNGTNDRRPSLFNITRNSSLEREEERLQRSIIRKGGGEADGATVKAWLEENWRAKRRERVSVCLCEESAEPSRSVFPTPAFRLGGCQPIAGLCLAGRYGAHCSTSQDCQGDQRMWPKRLPRCFSISGNHPLSPPSRPNRTSRFPLRGWALLPRPSSQHPSVLLSLCNHLPCPHCRDHLSFA